MRREDLLDLNEVLQYPGRQISVEISTELDQEEDIDLIKPLEGELHAVSTGNILIITGHFETTMVLECSRCSNPVETPIDFDIEEHFPVVGTPSSLSAQDMATVAPEEPYPLFEGNNLMVEALLRQDLLVSIPMHVECPPGTCSYNEQQSKLQSQESGRPEFIDLANKLKLKENLEDQD
jgi:uncharacterized metal-binding protein YceD (DUF177 family)